MHGERRLGVKNEVADQASMGPELLGRRQSLSWEPHVSSPGHTTQGNDVLALFTEQNPEHDTDF